MSTSFLKLSKKQSVVGVEPTSCLLRCAVQARVGLTVSAKVLISITHLIHIGLVHTPVYHFRHTDCYLES